MKRSPGVLLVAVLCLMRCVSAAAASSPTIAPEALVPHLLEFPGFGLAEHALMSQRSAFSYASTFLGMPPRRARREARVLMREGFREAVQETYAAEHTEAVAQAIVFRSARGTRWEMRRTATEERTVKGFEASVPDAAIPGLQGFTGSARVHIREGGRRVVVLRRYVDVQFSDGRCYVMIGDALYGSSTVQEAARGPIAAAAAVDARAKRLCGAGSRARR